MHRHECVSCVRVCESEQGCVEACVQFFGSTAARVLCSSGALLEAAVSIVWERRVSTYYTSQMVHRKYQRERERERCRGGMGLHFLDWAPFGSTTLLE